MKKNVYQAPVTEVIEMKGRVAPLCTSETFGGGGGGFARELEEPEE